MSIKDRYEQIKERFIRNFSDGKKSEEYPHSVTVFRRELLRPKLNNSVQIIGRHYILKERAEEEGW